MNKRTISSIILVIIALSLIAPTVNAQAISVTVTDEETRVIVGFKDFQSEATIRNGGWKINHEFHTIPAVACSLPTFVIELLKKSPFVSYIEEDPVVTAVDAELDASWGVKKIGADTVWSTNPSNQGDGVKIAIIDTGINSNHEDLALNYKGGYDFVNKDADPFDDNGHGTHCAGIIAAANNDIAVVGVAPKAQLYSLKVLNAAGSGYTSDIVAAIQWAITNDMDVISMSLGSTVGSTALQQACDAAFNSGIVVVAAAGNNGAARIGSNIIYPARYANVIAVGATDQNNARASFSCTGPELDIMAPGVNILSDYIDVTPGDNMNRDVVYMSGTSMATPHVAGTAALVLKSAETGWATLGYTNGDGAWTSAEVTRVLTATADDLGATGKDNLFGYGIVDAAQAAIPPNSPPPTPSVLVNSVGITSPSGSTGGTVATGEVFTVVSQIRLNTGSASVTAALTVPAGYTIETSPSAQTVGTSNVAFTWTVTAPSSAAAPALASVKASATNYAPGTGSFSVTTVSAAQLVGTFQAPPTSNVNVGNAITVTMRVTNTGVASATAVAPVTLTLIGTGAATLATGPSPASATILGGTYADFTWTYTASQTGTLTFSGSASGTAQYSGLSIATGPVGPSNTVTINTPPPPPPEITLPPTSLSITSGTIASGSVTNLNSNDGSYLTIRSTRISSRTQTADWNTKTSIAPVDPSKVTNITITYDGKYSTSSITQRLYIYVYTTKTWVQIDSRTVSTSDTKITWSTLNPANYISATGEISLRVYATKTTSSQFTCSADYAAFTIKYNP